jgi:hypothetical protein
MAELGSRAACRRGAPRERRASALPRKKREARPARLLSAWSAGLAFDYARDPFVLRSCASTSDCSKPNASEGDVHVVRDMLCRARQAAARRAPAKP